MSDLMATRTRTTAPSGGLPGRIAAHATCALDTQKSTMSRATICSSTNGCSRPSTGTRGSGSRIMIASATPIPPSTLAHEMVPHSSTHTDVSQVIVHNRTATSRASPPSHLGSRILPCSHTQNPRTAHATTRNDSRHTLISADRIGPFLATG